jgi:hypothetical protein
MQDKKMVVMISKDGQAMNQKAGAVTFGPGPGAPMPELRMRATMGQGWFAQLPDPMKENLLEWMFYIMTHKPPEAGMPPMAGAPGNPEMEKRFRAAIEEKDATIKKQQERIGEMEKAIQELKAKIEELQKKPNG